MTLNRLLNHPRLAEIADCAEEIQQKCNELQDALCQYEATEDLPKGERAAERESIREQVVDTMGEIISDVRAFEKLHALFEADGGASLPAPDAALISYGEAVPPTKADQERRANERGQTGPVDLSDLPPGSNP